MRKIFALLALAFVLGSCNNGGMDEIEESFKAENPFLGVWVPVNGYDAEFVFWANGIVDTIERGVPVSHTLYSYDGETFFLFTSTQARDLNIPSGQFPYNFSNKRTFVFVQKTEIKKVRLKPDR